MSTASLLVGRKVQKVTNSMFPEYVLTYPTSSLKWPILCWVGR